MKRFFLVFCIAAMLFSLSACSNTAEAESTAASETVSETVSESTAAGGSAPEHIDVQHATAWDIIRYFKAFGLFTSGDGYTVTIQDHENYWSGTPIREGISWWDNTGTEVSVNILILDPSLEDSSRQQYEDWKKEIRITKSLPGEYFSFGFIDHLAGNIAFSYSTATPDEAMLKKVEDAYEQFVQASGVTPEY